ncbi:MAG: GGDEF domain-containing protein, partial [Desulfobulbaceae bacterium]|nr:GGDEF domain-containing protein [Desulfobulbaceae bacterium]
EPFGAYVHNKLLMRKLEEKANTDPMTGLYNRGYLDQAIKEETEKLKKFNIQYSIVMADVNRLKKANDDYGHEAGDNLILTVADLLEKEVRPMDVVARTGGDEFLILLADCNNEGANNFINRLTKKTFHEVSIEVGKNERFPVTVSFGAAGTDKYKPEELIKEADRTMYENKEAFYAKNKNLRYR